jgi:hypothetical protein
LSAEIPARSRAADIRRLLVEHKETLCLAASTFAIDGRLIAGVVLAENGLNVGRGDDLQAPYLKGLLATRGDAWFREWKDRNEQSAQQAMSVRLISNKWPVDLWLSGYVQSYGPARVTPRTAIAACERLQVHFPACRKSPREVVRAIVEVPDFLYIVAAVLRSEIESAPQEWVSEVRADPALWATLYNVGGEYFFTTYATRYGVKPNKFGSFVRRSIESSAPEGRCDRAD